MDTYGNIYIYTITLNIFGNIWKLFGHIWEYIYIYNWNLPFGFLNIATEAIAHVVRGF